MTRLVPSLGLVVKGLGDGCSTIDDYILYGNDSLTEISDSRYIRRGKMDGGQDKSVSKKKKKKGNGRGTGDGARERYTSSFLDHLRYL